MLRTLHQIPRQVLFYILHGLVFALAAWVSLAQAAAASTACTHSHRDAYCSHHAREGLVPRHREAAFSRYQFAHRQRFQDRFGAAAWAQPNATTLPSVGEPSSDDAAKQPGALAWRHRRANRAPSFDRDFRGGLRMHSLAERAARQNGVPVSLVDRVIRRESGGNPRAVSAGNYGLMQIRLGTARAMGYRGSAAGLLDPVTNMTYAVRYLSGAYRAAGGRESRAVALYARGYNARPVVQNASYWSVKRAGGGLARPSHGDWFGRPGH
jgi:soluble lytic murein transglycosylase-like protein